MVEPRRMYSILQLVVYNIPFLLELKTVLDWCFTKTALDTMEWL